MARNRGAGLIAAAQAARVRAEAPEAQEAAPPASAAAEIAPAAPAAPAAAETQHGTATADYVTTAIHVPRDVLLLLRRVAVERANLQGGRPSVSAVLTDLVRENKEALEREAGR